MRRSFGAILFLLFMIVWALFTKIDTHSWQEESRMATIQTLVEQNTFAIDHTEFNRTGDKVFVSDHFYSDKTPLLSVVAAGGYSILHNSFYLTLDPTICVPDEDVAACRVFDGKNFRFTAFYWLTLIFIGGSSALLVTLSWRAMLDTGAGGILSTALALAVGLASPIAPYSIVFAGHVPAALCLFAGFFLFVRCHSERGDESLSQIYRKDNRNLFFAGLLISLSANIDLTLAVFIAAFGLWILLARRNNFLSYLIGAIVPFAVSAAINYWAAGSIMPLYFDPNAYDFFGTVLNKSVGGTNGFYSLDFGLRYTYDLLIGARGLFSFTPMLIFAIVGLWIVLRDRANRLRGLTFAVIAGSLTFTLYLIFRTDNFGGEAWGTRWIVPLAPMLMYYAGNAYRISALTYRGALVWRIVFWLLVILSFATAVYGLHDAWKSVPPIVRL
ncbi:MAG TPA: hypothetical protein VFF70_15440 [Anaerolineae bacterium]|jgi:hypothetical protein|nr:hypothetical protein [Anaerolineae bacterium]